MQEGMEKTLQVGLIETLINNGFVLSTAWETSKVVRFKETYVRR